jgi:hypothetical protein
MPSKIKSIKKMKGGSRSGRSNVRQDIQNLWDIVRDIHKSLIPVFKSQEAAQILAQEIASATVAAAHIPDGPVDTISLYRTLRPVIIVNEDGTDIDDTTLYYRQWHPYHNGQPPYPPPFPTSPHRRDTTEILHESKIKTNIYTIEQEPNLVSITVGGALDHRQNQANTTLSLKKSWRDHQVFKLGEMKPIENAQMFDIQATNTYRINLIGQIQYKNIYKGDKGDGSDSVWGWVRVE